MGTGLKGQIVGSRRVEDPRNAGPQPPVQNTHTLISLKD